MIELLAIPAGAYLRRLQGRGVINKLLTKALYVALAVFVFWPRWDLGLIAGAYVVFNLTWAHEFGDRGWDAVRRYGPLGLGYPLAFKYRAEGCWSCIGELWLGGSMFTVLVLLSYLK